jgi:hypothetical protein
MNASKKFCMYYDSNLPKDGWLQTCIVCDRVTSKTVFYKIIKKNRKTKIEVYNYLCNTCQKKLSNKEFYKTYTNNSDELLELNDSVIFP